MGVGYWPAGAPREVTLAAFTQAYGILGFRLCFDGALENGIQKLALYGKGPLGAEIPTHAALQLPSGRWTSKLGPFEDIDHETDDAVNGPVYGRRICYFSRPRPLVLF